MTAHRNIRARNTRTGAIPARGTTAKNGRFRRCRVCNRLYPEVMRPGSAGICPACYYFVYADDED